MAFKFVALLAFIATARAGVISSVNDDAYSTSGKSSVAYADSGYAEVNEDAHQTAEYPQQVAYARPVAYQAAPAAVLKAQPVLTKSVEEYDPHPQYKFGYDVQDTISGDSKSQVETRDGDLVQGEYSLIDADGYRRTVRYTADSVHGFNAVVSREPINVAVKAVAAPAAIVKAAVPVQLGYAAYTAREAQAEGPVVKGAYAARPVVKATPVAYPISDSDH